MVTSQVVVHGPERRRTLVTKVVVPYQVALYGMADGHTDALPAARITYKTAKPAQPARTQA